MKEMIIILLACVLGMYCNSSDPLKSKVQNASSGILPQSRINENGKTIESRFPAPEGFQRAEAEPISFAYYLRNLPLKPHGTKVKLYNGQNKWSDVHEAVVDIDVGKRDLQQCADAVMRLRAEYLYSQQRYEDIHFNFANGFRVDYSKWREGNRIIVEGNKTYWKATTAPSNTYKSFRGYMNIIFAYAGTLSLSKELTKVDIDDMEIGDVFIQGGSPGHAVIVVDLVVQQSTGEKLFMIAQSYMPAQDIHVLKNPNNVRLSPWYPANFEGPLQTPEWTFEKDDLRRFE